MAEVFKAIMMGIGCLGLLWLGSCTLFGVGTVVALNGAAEQMKDEKADARAAAQRAEAARWSSQRASTDWARGGGSYRSSDSYQQDPATTSRQMGRPSAKLGEPTTQLPSNN